MGSAFAKESEEGLKSSAAAQKFLARASEVAQTKGARDEDLRVVAAFIGRCVAAAGARATFLYAGEPESANLWAAAEALRVLATLLAPETPFAHCTALRALAETVVAALEARDSLLVRDATVAEAARGAVTRLVDLVRDAADYAALRGRAERLVAAGGALSYGHGRGADGVPAVGSLKLGVTYLFKSLANAYLSADVRGAVRVHPGMYTPSDAWTVCAVPDDDDAVALRSLHGTYLALVGRRHQSRSSKSKEEKEEEEKQEQQEQEKQQQEQQQEKQQKEVRVAAVRCAEGKFPARVRWYPTRTDDGFVVLRTARGRCVAGDAAGHVLLARTAGGDALVGCWAAMRCPRSVELSAHEWEAGAITTPVWCNCCGSFIWGLGTQVHRCRRCGLCVHRTCVAAVGDSCESSVRLLFGDQTLDGTKQGQQGQQEQEQKQKEEEEEPKVSPEERMLAVSRVCSGPVLTEKEAEEKEAACEILFQTRRHAARANDIECNIFSEADVASSTIGLHIPAPDETTGAEPTEQVVEEKKQPQPAPAAPATPPALPPKPEAAKPEAAKPEAAKPEAAKPSPGPNRRPAPKKLVSSAMRNQLENMMRGGGGGMGMPPMMMGPNARRPPAAASKKAAEEDEGTDKNVVHVGELGMPVTTAPRLQHFTRARGPKRRPPAAAAV